MELTEAEQIAQACTSSGHQTSILTQVRLLQHTQRELYIRKFQNAHFAVIKNFLTFTKRLQNMKKIYIKWVWALVS